MRGKPTIPIIFSPEYDIGLYGIEKLHPFDSKKYGRVRRYLRDDAGFPPEVFHEPHEVSGDDLLRVHTKKYLESLKKPYNVAPIAELMSLALIPGSLLDRHLLRPMRYATGGTILGFRLALEHGRAINLGGGYHHAKSDEGGGFCYYGDVAVAAKVLWEEEPGVNLSIVDLDAHQGNGNACLFKDDPRVKILDIYNGYIYPGDREAKRYVEFDRPVKMYVQDGEYLDLLESSLEEFLSEPKPDLLVYNAGTDVLVGDPLGGMSISVEGVIRRDGIVFRAASDRGIPILMLLSGGYTRRSAKVISKSIENLESGTAPPSV